MEELHTELNNLATQFTKYGDDMSSALMSVMDSLKGMANTHGEAVKNIQGLNNWLLTIDDSLCDLHHTIEEVGTRVAVLELEGTTPEDRTPRPEAHGAATTNQGTVTAAPRATAPALAKDTRVFRHTPITFDLSGDDDCESGMHQHRSRFKSNRTPKSDFPKFNGDNPK